ncbi:MAG: type II secretion system F family protein [Phycisphaerae bacterium]|jgi:general secretion pathway protein F/type IV pilus assembly protein PilC
MPTFAYRARNASGDAVQGTLVADTPLAVTRILDERALVPVEVNEVKAQERSILTGQARRVSPSKVGVLYEQLADLLKAGVPVLRALNVLSRQAGSPALVRVLREVHDDVAGGDTLADAMDKHKHAFPTLHVSMVRAGEKGGFLEDVLQRLSEFVARQDELRNKFIGSMIYPCVLLGGGLAAVSLLMVMVVPRIRDLLEAQNLPFATVVVFALSDLLSKYYLWLAGSIVVVVSMVTWFFRSQVGRAIWARLQLRAWGVGKIFTMVALCRFCRVFGTMLANGIPIIHALRISKDSTGNQILADVIDKAADNVAAGEPLAEPLAKSKVFPAAMIDMITVAEESNTLEKVLIEIANTQEARTARQIDLFVRLLEPMMLLIMGVMVMFIAVALLLPILRMATSGFQQ